MRRRLTVKLIHAIIARDFMFRSTCVKRPDSASLLPHLGALYDGERGEEKAKNK
jgi:hypothetical protein